MSSENPNDPSHSGPPGRVITSWEDAQAVGALIRLRGKVRFTAASGSMEPLIMTGSQIEVGPIDSFDDLRTFDILLFWNGERLICHYLWHINTLTNPDGERTVVTRPLASYQGEDLPVPTGHILGRIISHKISFWRKLAIILHKRGKDARYGILS
jgi:hypothetical protein